MSLSRRKLLAGLVGGAAAWPLSHLAGSSFLPALGDGVARASAAGARRLIVFYFPDGVAGRSQDGEASLWPARYEGGRVVLSELLQPLGARARDCVFIDGLSMGGTDQGSHPGGAKKLLTASDGGRGESIDQRLARTGGASVPCRHLYLGVQANADSPPSDTRISYSGSEITAAPEDDPVRAFGRLFGEGVMPTPGEDPRALDRSILDLASQDLDSLRGRAGGAERAKMELHAEALREVEARLATLSGGMSGECEAPTLGWSGMASGALHQPENFDRLLRAQIDLSVTAMACGLTKVGVVQCSRHTSELIMSRIPETEFHDPGFDMRSHQASHYGARHDRGNRLFTSFLAQRRYFVDRFRYLLDALAARPEGDGTMLDHSLVLLTSEVSDGNTHSHEDMPFVLAGRGGGCVTTDRVLSHSGRRHGELYVSLARAMGEPISAFGDAAWEPLPGLLSA